MNSKLRELLKISKAKKERKREAIEARYMERQQEEHEQIIEETPAIAITEVSLWQRMKDRVSGFWERGDAA